MGCRVGDTAIVSSSMIVPDLFKERNINRNDRNGSFRRKKTQNKNLLYFKPAILKGECFARLKRLETNSNMMLYQSGVIQGVGGVENRT